jgi:hypothetical protein
MLHPHLMKMQRKNLSIVAVWLLSCMLQAQKPDPPQWKEYTFPADNFAVTAPSSPQVYPDSQRDGVRIYRWDLGPGIILSLRAALRPDCRDTLKRIKDTKEQDQPKTIVRGSIKDVSQNGLEGLENESHYPGRWAAERIYCSKNRGYALSLSYPVNQPRPKVAVRMFESFRLLDSSQ